MTVLVDITSFHLVAAGFPSSPSGGVRRMTSVVAARHHPERRIRVDLISKTLRQEKNRLDDVRRVDGRVFPGGGRVRAAKKSASGRNPPDGPDEIDLSAAASIFTRTPEGSEGSNRGARVEGSRRGRSRRRHPRVYGTRQVRGGGGDFETGGDVSSISRGRDPRGCSCWGNDRPSRRRLRRFGRCRRRRRRRLCRRQLLSG